MLPGEWDKEHGYKLLRDIIKKRFEKNGIVDELLVDDTWVVITNDKEIMHSSSPRIILYIVDEISTSLQKGEL